MRSENTPSPHAACITLATLFLVVLWDLVGMDLQVARWMGTSYGFPWRFNARLELWLHTVPRVMGWMLATVLLVAIRRPFSVFRRIDAVSRIQLALGAVVSALLIVLLKAVSDTSCPYDLVQFGGATKYVPHWSLGIRDGGPGGCFPAGHASAAFAFVGGYFAFSRISPPIARIWLAATLTSGVALGLSQQLRGAHFTSHTLWTAWICWTTAYAIDVGACRYRAVTGVADHAVN